MATTPTIMSPVASSRMSVRSVAPSVPSPITTDTMGRGSKARPRSPTKLAMQALPTRESDAIIAPSPVKTLAWTASEAGSALSGGRSKVRRPKSASPTRRPLARKQSAASVVRPAAQFSNTFARSKMIPAMSKRGHDMKTKTRRLLKVNTRNVKPARAYSIAERVAHSPQKLSNTRRHGNRFGKAPRSQSTDACYNSDVGSAVSLAPRVDQCTDFLRWKPAPTERPKASVAGLQYNTDSLHKATIKTRVARQAHSGPTMSNSPSRWRTSKKAVMESHLGPGYVDVPANAVKRTRPRSARMGGRTPRFQDPTPRGGAPVYNLEAGPKATLAAAAARNSQRYSGMTSPTPRSGGVAKRDRELSLSLQKVDYNAHDAHTVAHSVQKSARSYQSAFHPDYPRFDNKDELGRDKELAFIMRTMQPPTPRHGTLAQEVEGSPRRYSPMVSPTSRFGDDKRRSGTPPHLGPGSTTPDVDVIHRRVYAANINQTRSPRFQQRDESHKSQATFSSQLERDAKHWHRASALISEDLPQRPQTPTSTLDKYYDPDTGVKASLKATVVNSRSNPHISYRSKVGRSKLERQSSCPKNLGPGSFSPVVLHHGKGSSLGQDPLSPRKAPAPHTARLAVTANLDATLPTPRTPAFTAFTNSAINAKIAQVDHL